MRKGRHIRGLLAGGAAALLALFVTIGIVVPQGASQALALEGPSAYGQAARLASLSQGATFDILKPHGFSLDSLSSSEKPGALAAASDSQSVPVVLSTDLGTVHTGQDVGMLYFEAEGNPDTFTWELAAGSQLPPGLELLNNAYIAGTPTKTGTYTFDVIATNSAGSSKPTTVTIVVNNQIDLTIWLNPINEGDVAGANLSSDYAPADAVWSPAAGTTIPDGVTLAADGSIRATKVGSYTFDANATDPSNPATVVPFVVNVRVADYKYNVKQSTGTVYITITDKGKFPTSDGEIAGVPMWHVPVSLNDLWHMDLDKIYLGGSQTSLGTNNYDVDDDGSYEVTALQLVAYVSEHYSAGGLDGCGLTGANGHMWFSTFFGGGYGNFITYSLNDTAPVDEKLTRQNKGGGNIGATLDHYVLEDGDNFVFHQQAYDDPANGYFFIDPVNGDPNIQDKSQLIYDWSATAGEAFPVRIKSMSLNGDNGYGSACKPYSPANKAADHLLYSEGLYDPDNAKKISATFDDKGTATIEFDEPGTYYVWNADVKSPGMLKVDVAPTTPTAERVAGQTAADTAAAIAAKAYPDGASAVVIATDASYYDALSATALAGAAKAPILLTGSEGLSQAAADEVAALGANTAYVVGGTGALSAQVDANLAAAGVTSERVFGQTVADTSLACAKKTAELGGSAERAIVASPASFADALSASGWAYSACVPVVIEGEGATSADRTLSDDAKAFLAGRRVTVLGGTGAVSDESVAGLDVAERLWGQTAYDTSNAIATALVADGRLDPSTLVVATGAEAAGGLDALAGSALAGVAKAPVVLVSGNAALEAEDYTTVDGYIASHKGDIKTDYVLGGEFVMPQAAYDRVAAAIGATQEQESAE